VENDDSGGGGGGGGDEGERTGKRRGDGDVPDDSVEIGLSVQVEGEDEVGITEPQNPVETEIMEALAEETSEETERVAESTVAEGSAEIEMNEVQERLEQEM
jgi:hypothetical protein